MNTEDLQNQNSKQLAYKGPLDCVLEVIAHLTLLSSWVASMSPIIDSRRKTPDFKIPLLKIESEVKGATHNSWVE